MPYSVVQCYLCLRGNCFLNLEVIKTFVFLVSSIVLPWRQKQHFSPKSGKCVTKLLLPVTAMSTSNPTRSNTFSSMSVMLQFFRLQLNLQIVHPPPFQILANIFCVFLKYSWFHHPIHIRRLLQIIKLMNIYILRVPVVSVPLYPNGRSFKHPFSNNHSVRWRERTNKMQLIRCLLSNFLSQHVSGIIMPIIRRIRPCPASCGVVLGCVGCGWLWSCGAGSCMTQNTAWSRTRSYSPDDGHNDARNMLR